MDACNDPTTEVIVVMCSAQVGKTEVLNNIVGYHIDLDPGPILVLQPNTKPMAEAWSKDRLAPMLRDTPCLRGKVSDPKGRDSGNTILHKVFPGGHLTVAGANSPAGLASRPIRLVLCDEVDRYPPSAGTEGDPISLARKRTTTYNGNRLLLMTSTPTVKGASRIETAFEETTQERYHVPCPSCSQRQVLKFEQVRFDEEDPSSARYACAFCDALWTDALRWRTLRGGEWIADKPGRRARGFHLNELYSPWVTLEEVVESYLESKALPETFKTWVNTVLGESFEQEGEQAADSDLLYARREGYEWAPSDVVLVTAGVDIQKDRIEAEKVGWSTTLESWSLDYRVFAGNPQTLPGEEGSPWEELDAWLLEPAPRDDGAELPTYATCIDSGFESDAVYIFCRRRRSRRVYAIKGMAGMGRPGNAGWTWTAKRKESRANLCKLFTLGVDTLKSKLYGRLGIEVVGAGYCHFPERYEQAYFDQLTAERAIKRKTRTGRPIVEWTQTQERNEALDCRVYAMGALEIARPGPAMWKRAARVALAQANDDDSTPPTAAAPPPQDVAAAVTPPSARRRRGGGGKNFATDFRL